MDCVRLSATRPLGEYAEGGAAMSGEKWLEVTKANPCPACGKGDWCAWTPDGAMLKCERITEAPAGMVLVKAQDGGGLFRREGDSASSSPVPTDRPRPAKPAGAKSKARIVKTYDYKDAAGAMLFQKVRYEPKDFRIRRPDNRGGWTWNLGDVPRVLYRLPELLAADKGDWVFVCEGEKDTDNLADLGLLATTNPGGAGKWKHLADDSALHGRRVAILWDKDAPDKSGKVAGWEHAQDVAARLYGKAAVVKIIDLPNMPAKDDGRPRKDVSDWLEWLDGKTGEELAAALVSMADAAPAWTPKADAKASAPACGPVLVCMANVKPEPVRWLWPSRIALGKLTLLVGDPKVGKSFITLDLAARVSRGDGWPDFPASTAAPGGVVLLSAEDDLGDTIRPRLDAAGADVSRVKALVAVKRFDFEAGGERQCFFDLSKDLAALEKAILDVPDCRLVVIDPITAYLGATDSHKNAEIRGLLAPLSEIASRCGVAIVAVTHLRKGEGRAMYRAIGSIAFTAAARAVYSVSKDKDDPTGQRRLVLPVGNNLGNDTTGLAYRLDPTESANGQPVVKWEADPVSTTADEALSDDKPAGGDDDGGTERGEAATWLRDALAAGPLEAKYVYTQARQDGIHKRTLDRAKRDLGVIAYKVGFGADGSWRWKLPQAPDDGGQDGQAIDCHAPDGQAPTPETVATFGDAGNLWEKPQENADSGRAQNAPEPKDCQAPESGNVCPDRLAGRLDPDTPGPVDLLPKDRLPTYKAVYSTRPASMSPEEKHRRAWRAAVRPEQG